MKKTRVYLYTNPYIREMIRRKIWEWWWYFSLVIIPLGMVIYSPVATYIDRLDGASAAAGIGFWDEMIDHHALSLIFGLTFLIVFAIGFFSVDRYDLAQNCSLHTVGRPVSPEEVDAEANDPASEWLPNLHVILTPRLMIGYYNGITVGRYEDIKELRIKKVKKRVHVRFGKWTDMDAFEFYPYGMIFSESFEDPELIMMELDIIQEKCRKLYPDKKIRIRKEK